MRTPSYEENQWFASWVYVMLAGVAVSFSLAVWLAAAPGDTGAWYLHAAILAGLMLVANVLFLTTRAGNGELYIRFGVFFPLYRKRIPLSEISEVRCVTYRPLVNAGGWGIRFGRFEGALCWFYNARGNQGVFFQTPKYRCIVGSQDPEHLEAALRAAIEDGRS